MKKWNLIAGLVLLTAFMSIAQADDAADTPLFNDKCPITGRDVNAAQTSEYKVEFCCKRCKAKFDKEPEKYMDKVAAGEEGKCIFNGREAKTSTTLNIGFCCAGCKAKFDEDPSAIIGKVKPAAKEEE